MGHKSVKPKKESSCNKAYAVVNSYCEIKTLSELRSQLDDDFVVYKTKQDAMDDIDEDQDHSYVIELTIDKVFKTKKEPDLVEVKLK